MCTSLPPVLHSLAGKPIDQPGIFEGFDRLPPIIFNASSVFIYPVLSYIYYLSSLKLEACSLPLAACSLGPGPEASANDLLKFCYTLCRRLVSFFNLFQVFIFNTITKAAVITGVFILLAIDALPVFINF
jgi:hypothetical protein